MMRIVDCLSVDHDPGLVLLAALICIVGCAASVVVASRALTGERVLLWLALLSLCSGCALWSTHFMAMLAYQTSVPMTYDLSLTALSLLAGIALFSAGFTLALHYRSRRYMRLLGGLVVGAGVSALHYIGMAGLRFPGSMSQDIDLILVSLLCAGLFGALAVERLFADQGMVTRLAGGGLLVLMTVSLHFIGMSAVRIELGVFEAGPGFSRSLLIIGVALASLIVLTIGFLAALLDQRMSQRLAAQAERFRMLADGAFEGLVVLRGERIVDSNLAARGQLGIDENSQASVLSDWAIPAVSGLQLGGEAITQEIRIHREGRCDFPAEIRRRAIRLHNGDIGEMIAIQDLTQRKQNEERITHLSLHDALTDLPNRRFFEQLSDNALGHARRTASNMALLTVDLDNFKGVNDLYGHEAGDELIRQIARLLQSLSAASDVLARQGGDEFTILCTADDQPAQCIDLAQRIHTALAEGVRVQGRQIVVEASIGMAIYPTDGKDLEELMRNADTAMHVSKDHGMGFTHFFEPHMNEQLDRRRMLEQRLRLALELGSLSLNYQPLVSCPDREPVCFEALLRWHDPELGHVSPADFIPVAEQTGLIIPIGEFVLRQACRDAASWPSTISVAVNLSVAQFVRQDIHQLVQSVLHDCDLPAHRLELEITESLLMENKAEAVKKLDELRSLGVGIAMDDFGTGYSSLGYLQSFNFSKIKIDRAFVNALDSKQQNASIVQAIIAMGKSLQMRVVAEGVETMEQAELLATLGCDELQGYLISRPIPVGEVRSFLQGWSSSPSTGREPPAEAA